VDYLREKFSLDIVGGALHSIILCIPSTTTNHHHHNHHQQQQQQKLYMLGWSIRITS
jgi:hypothetical protein